ncbi:CdaR family transcriptional regulator [Streptomyces sp. NBRC 110028]|uniref:PucR family transcriptional regulator n=1 Tax=Streptomyces sp. NBRC 110028 TaxID=1621260 RepID=UPI0006E2695F|nr:helix-turn-helix domain-containing protein [Streptomyces sp. NBRC 110028]
MAASPSDARAERADDVLALARLAARRGAVRVMLDWLTRRTGGPAMLIGADGSVLATADDPPPPASLRRLAAEAAVELHRRGVPSGVLGGGEARPVHLVALGPTEPRDPAPYLAVVAPSAPRCGPLLADASRTLGLSWRVEEAERARRRVETAEAYSREAVLHLLMSGSVPAAQRIAAALRPALPTVLQVYVIECPVHRRREIAGRIHDSVRGRAWLVPCPVRPNHLISLVPAQGEPVAPDGEPLDRLITRQETEVRVGVSAEVALRDAPVGYEQAFHALAVARNAPGRSAGFGGHSDVTVLASPEGHAWASALLAPCLEYAPTRRADPGPAELLGTLGSWLSFGSAATRHLKIHRNTLAARLRHIDGLLGVDVSRDLAAQSAAWLALRLHQAPRGTAPAGHPATLDGVLSTPTAAIWARAQLRPLDQANLTAVSESVRAWLRADARLPAAASALGISLPGARKRLTRAEDALGRSLLSAPSAKYELWLATRALGGL